MKLLYNKMSVAILSFLLFMPTAEAKRSTKGIKSRAVVKAISGTQNKVFGEVIPKTQKQKAMEVSRKYNHNKNSVTIKHGDEIIRGDLKGASHFNKETKEYVDTPHVQVTKLTKNIDPVTKETYVNRKKQAATEMTDREIRMFRNYLKSKQNYLKSKQRRNLKSK